MARQDASRDEILRRLASLDVGERQQILRSGGVADHYRELGQRVLADDQRPTWTRAALLDAMQARHARDTSAVMPPAAPPVRGPRDLPALRAWLLDRWAPAGVFSRAAVMSGSIQPAGAAYTGFEDQLLWERTKADWERDTLAQAALWWVSVDLTAVVEAAAPSVPGDHLMRDAPPLHPYGLAVFARPLSGLDAERDATVRMDAMLWGPVNLVPFEVGEGPEVVGGLGVGISWYRFGWLDLRDLADRPDSAAPFAAGGLVDVEPPGGMRMWMPLGRTDWPAATSIATPHIAGLEHDGARFASMQEDRRLASSLWATAVATKVVDTVQVRPDRPAQKRLARSHPSLDDRVTVVHLRRETAPGEAEADSDGPERRYVHRWIVHPHFRQQPFGRGRAQRKLILVGPYVKGPAGAPLLRAHRVWSLDR